MKSQSQKWLQSSIQIIKEDIVEKLNVLKNNSLKEEDANVLQEAIDEIIKTRKERKELFNEFIERGNHISVTWDVDKGYIE